MIDGFVGAWRPDVGGPFTEFMLFVSQVSFDRADLVENVRATMVAISNLKPEVIKGKYIAQVCRCVNRAPPCVAVPCRGCLGDGGELCSRQQGLGQECLVRTAGLFNYDTQ